jgi:hypothetical protein
MLSAEHAQCFSGVEDADVSEGAEDEQILIAGGGEHSHCECSKNSFTHNAGRFMRAWLAPSRRLPSA